MKVTKKQNLLLLGFILIATVFITGKTNAHCDTMDGPVVKAAQQGLETGNVNYVLIWVQKKDEDEIKKSFEKTLALRKINKDAETMADMYFFETLIRVHRLGEGASYTGIKPAGTDIGYVIPEIDKSVAAGNSSKLSELVLKAIKDKIDMQFRELMEKKDFKINDLTEGRNFIKTYVEFLHFIEGVYNMTEIHNEHEKHNH